MTSALTDVAVYTLRGIPIGGVFALLAVGLVLNYKTSGVFNLAFGAQAFVSAAVFYVVRKNHEWPLLWAVLLAVFVVGPLLGVLLDRALYRHLRTASPLTKLVTSLGLLIALPEVTKVALDLGDRPQYNPPPLWPTRRIDQYVWFRGSAFALNAGQIVTLAATAVVLAGLWVLFARSTIGLRMRAVVESPRLVQLQGIDADRVAGHSWILSSTIAGLAGVLLSPLFAALVAIDLFTLLVAALAAAVFAGLTSIPRAVVGGLVLGVIQQLLTGFLPNDTPTWSTISRAIRPSTPFLALFGILVIRLVAATLKGREVSFGDEITDPMSGVDPPPPAPVALVRPPWMAAGSRAFGVLVLVVGAYLVWAVLDAEWLAIVGSGVCLAVILLSLTMVTGIGGTLSLCQASFAAVGAFTTAKLVSGTGMPVLVAMVLGALVAALVGAVVAIPVVRLPAVYAALATLAFALFFEQTIRPLEWVSGGSVPLDVPRPTIGSLDLSDNRWFVTLAAVVCAIVAFGVILVRRGTTGRFLDAVRGSEVAAASVGINPARLRLVAFTIAAAVAGFGGGLLASFDQEANYESRFVFYFGLVWVALVITAGARSVQAAIFSGIMFFAFPKLLEMLFSWPGNYLTSNPGTSGFARSLLEIPQPGWAQSVAFILFGLGAFTYAKHPEGIVEFQTTAAVARIAPRVERWLGKDTRSDAGTQPPEVRDVAA